MADRERDEPISKATALPAINLGLAITIILMIWFGAQKVRDIENLVNDTAGRQAKYVGMEGLYTREITSLLAQVRDLEIDIIILKERNDDRP